MPNVDLKLGQVPPERTASIRIIHSGTVATSNAAKLDGMNCAAQTTPPLPPTKSRMPMVAALRHSSLLGAGSPAMRRQKYKNAPEMIKRAAADKNGGNVSTAKRIAR